MQYALFVLGNRGNRLYVSPARAVGRLYVLLSVQGGRNIGHAFGEPRDHRFEFFELARNGYNVARYPGYCKLEFLEFSRN